MEKIVDFLLNNSDNARMLLLIAVGYCGYLKLMGQTKSLGYSLNKKMDDGFNFLDKKIDVKFGVLDKRIDGVEASLNKRIDELKYNDFAHLDKKIDGVEASIKAAIQALTFTLEKNKFLEKEDKEYIDGRLNEK